MALGERGGLGAVGREQRTILGRFVHTTWGNLNIRCANGKYRTGTKKNECYNDVFIRFSREEFKSWCKSQEETIKSLERPSLDRIDSSKDYTLDNLQIIELEDNIRKDKTVFNNGIGTCYSCREEKPLEDFVKDKRRKNGRKNLCVLCERKRGREKYARLYRVEKD